MRSARHRPQCRSGITTIELVIALTIASTMATIGAIGVLPFLKKNKVVEAVNAIDRAANEARTYARLRPETGTDFFGVTLIGNSVPNQAVLVQRSASGERELARFAFNRNVQLYQGDQPLNGTISWFCQPRTGYPTATPGGVVVPVAAVAIGNAKHLSVRTLDGRFRSGVAIYEIGVIAAEEF